MKASQIIAACLAAAVMLPVPAAVSAAEPTVNATEVTIYHLSADYADDLTMPADYPEEFQLAVSGAESVTYRLDSGSVGISVSDTGMITCAPDYWYWYGSVGYSIPMSDQEPDEITERLTYGDRDVIVTADGTTLRVTVHLIDYSEQYYNEVLDGVIAERITDDMTGEEKLRAIAGYVADYDYDYHYYVGKSMVIHKGGDCWASVDLVNALCEKAGIPSWTRNGNLDLGAGSGHRNVIAYVDDTYYQVDAGYSGTAPRYYSVSERDSLFSYRVTNSTDKTCTVTQYDGRDSVLEVPAELGGYTVTSLNANCFYRNSANFTLAEVTLPDTLTEIGAAAFYGCTALTDVTIPAAVETIGASAFYGCTSLETVTFLNPDCVFPEEDEGKNMFAKSENVTIIGYTGSTAQAYAAQYGHSFRALDAETTEPAAVLAGDVNEDGKVNIMDVITLNKNLLGGCTLSEQGRLNANVDQSEKVDSADALSIMKYIVGIVTDWAEIR